MANTIKITCSNASFVDKHNPSHNYSNFDTLSAGLVNTRISGFHIFKSILAFNIPKIQADNIINAYLFIFIKKLQYSGNTPESIGICGNYSNVNTNTVTWDTFPTEKFTPVYHLNIPQNSSNSYIKINVTEIIKDLCTNSEYYNLILCPIDSKSQIIATFNSTTSDNPPYLKIEYDKKDEFENKPNISSYTDIHSAKPHIQPSENNNIKELISTISESLSTQSQSLSSLQNKLENCPPKEILEGISEKLSTQSQELLSLKDNFNAIYSSYDFNSMIELINSISDKINFLPEICSCDDLKVISDSIEVLSENINSYNDILSSLNESLSSSPVSNKIEIAINLINELKSNILLQEDNIDTIINKIGMANISLEKIAENKNSSINLEDIENINTNIASLQTHISKLNDEISTIKDFTSNFENNNSDLINTNTQTITKKLDNIIPDLYESAKDNLELINTNCENIFNQTQLNNVSIDSLKDIISNLSNNNLDLLNSNNTIFDKIQSNTELLNTKYDYISNKIQSNSDNINSIKIEFDNISNTINSINNKLNIIDKIDERLSNYEKFQQANSDSILCLSDNINILSKNLINIKDSINPLKDNLANLNTEILSIRDFLKDIPDKISSASDNSTSCNMDEISNKLSDLSTSINQISNSLSEITIDPLN